jgi:hypothetical protein
MGLGGSARADGEGFEPRHFRPAPDGLGVLSIESPEVLAPWAITLGLFYDVSFGTVELEGDQTGNTIDDVVDDYHVFNLQGAVGLPKDLSVSFALPVVADSQGERLDKPGRRIGDGGIGDLRLDLKWKGLTAVGRRLALGADLLMTFPTGDDARMRGDGGHFTLGLDGLLEYRISRFRLLARVGYQWREDAYTLAGVDVGDRVRLGGAIAFVVFGKPKGDSGGGGPVGPPPLPSAGPPITEHPERSKRDWRLDLELSIDSSLRVKNASQKATFPAEIAVGARLDFPIPIGLIGGIGFGITSGIGAPDIRGFFGVVFDVVGKERRADSWRFAKRKGFLD